MRDLLNKFESKKPEIVFEWKDTETEAEGWIVINSLRGGAAAGVQGAERQAHQLPHAAGADGEADHIHCRDASGGRLRAEALQVPIRCQRSPRV